MTTQFDELSKSLAAGMSRRKAARSFLAGLGGAAFAAFTGKQALAGTGAACDAWCATQAAQFQQLCLTASANCPDGMCASLLPAATAASKVSLMGVGRYKDLSPVPIANPLPGPTPISINSSPISINSTPISGINSSPIGPIGGTPISINSSPIGKLPTVPQYCVVVAASIGAPVPIGI